MSTGFYRLFVLHTPLEGDGVPASFLMISKVGDSLTPVTSFLSLSFKPHYHDE